MTPVTVGNPRSGLPGNDVIHLSSASPSPRTGIARKSPNGGHSRYTLGGITHSPAWWRSSAARTRSIATDGETAASTVSWSRTGSPGTVQDDTLASHRHESPPAADDRRAGFLA